MGTVDLRLSWDGLARLYDASNGGGRPARTLPMDYVFAWAERQPDRFIVDDEGYLYARRDPRPPRIPRRRGVK